MPLTQFADHQRRRQRTSRISSPTARLAPACSAATAASFGALRYRFNGQENMLAFGTFPATSLASARTKRDEARALLASGMNPSVKRKLDKIASVTAARNTFGDVAADHLAHMEANGTAATTMKKNRWMLQKLCTPIAKRPIADISAAEILDLLKKVEKSGRRETATSLRGKIGSVFRYGVVTLRATTDPTFALKGALLKPKVQHRAAIIDEKQVGALMRSIDEYDGWPTLRAALQLDRSDHDPPRRIARDEAKRNHFRQSDLAHPGRADENAPPP